MRIVFLAVLVLCFTACNEHRHKYEYCASEGGRIDKESMVIDIEHRRINGSDTSFEFSVVDLQFAKGFVKPFPFMLPTVPLAQMPAHWEYNGYEFVMSDSAAGKVDWVLINAREANGRGTMESQHNSSVLYSSKDGVIAMTLGQANARVTLLSCGQTHIHGGSF